MRMRFAVAGAVMSLALSVAAQNEMPMVHAKGSFDIKMTPAESTDFEKANDVARLTSNSDLRFQILDGEFRRAEYAV
jgi:hypothetical protein